jgi:LAO/AO transport system kinase
MQMHPLAKRVVEGDLRAAARAITWIENHHPEREQLLQELHPYTGKAFVVGITGSPGAGKSTMVDQFISFLRRKNLKLGIIAVDPTSPFTGGAILGDRVRMQRHATDPNVFIRSMGTRGHLGGLARHAKEAVRILDAYGSEVILVETVGVGQSELDIMHLADTTVVVLSPGLGDTMQAFKAGIMEIADLFAVNKADLDGADKLVAQVSGMLDIVKHDAPWRPPIVKLISAENKGIDDLWAAIESHRTYQQQSGAWQERRNEHQRNEVREIVEYEVARLIEHILSRGDVAQELQQIGERSQNPYRLARRIVEEIRKGGSTE